MSKISINIKQWKTSFTNIPANCLHFASYTQVQPVTSQRFIRHTIEIIHEQSSRKLYHFKVSIVNHPLEIY